MRQTWNYSQFDTDLKKVAQEDIKYLRKLNMSENNQMV